MKQRKKFKKVFIDLEYTGQHQFTTLVSIGMVGENNEELYLTFNDYDQTQVTSWLKKNVLSEIDSSKSVSKMDGLEKIQKWLNDYRKNESISFISFLGTCNGLEIPLPISDCILDRLIVLIFLDEVFVVIFLPFFQLP